jgi:hypothetical protein
MFYLGFLATTIMYCVVCRFRPRIFTMAPMCVFKERQARLSERLVGAHWKADRSLPSTHPRNRPLACGPRLTTSRGNQAWAGGVCSGADTAAAVLVITIRLLAVAVSDIGAAVTGDGLHEADASSPITWLRETAKAAHQDGPSNPSGRLGRLAQIPIDAAKPQGGDPATEMPYWEEAADVANRRADWLRRHCARLHCRVRPREPVSLDPEEAPSKSWHPVHPQLVHLFRHACLLWRLASPEQPPVALIIRVRQALAIQGAVRRCRNAISWNNNGVTWT